MQEVFVGTTSFWPSFLSFMITCQSNSWDLGTQWRHCNEDWQGEKRDVRWHQASCKHTGLARLSKLLGGKAACELSQKCCTTRLNMVGQSWGRSVNCDSCSYDSLGNYLTIHFCFLPSKFGYPGVLFTSCPDIWLASVSCPVGLLSSIPAVSRCTAIQFIELVMVIIFYAQLALFSQVAMATLMQDRYICTTHFNASIRLKQQKRPNDWTLGTPYLMLTVVK